MYKLIIIDKKPLGHAMNSGYSMIINHLPGKKIIINNSSRILFSSRLYRYINKKFFERRDVRAYTLASFLKEIKCLFICILNPFAKVFYLYGDTDLGFLPSFIHSKKIIVTYHHVPINLDYLLKKYASFRKPKTIFVVGISQLRVLYKNNIIYGSYMPHGVNVRFWAPISNYTPTFTAISVGSYLRDFVLLRRIADAIFNILPEFKLEIIGASNAITEFKGVCYVRFIDRLSDEQLRDKYNASCFNLLALEDASANNALLESISSGCPVVSTFNESSVEYLGHDYQFLFDPDSEFDKGVKLCLELLTNPVLNSSVRIFCHNRAKCFDWNIVASKVGSEIFKKTI